MYLSITAINFHLSIKLLFVAISVSPASTGIRMASSAVFNEKVAPYPRRSASLNHHKCYHMNPETFYTRKGLLRTLKTNDSGEELSVKAISRRSSSVSSSILSRGLESLSDWQKGCLSSNIKRIAKQNGDDSPCPSWILGEFSQAVASWTSEYRVTTAVVDFAAAVNQLDQLQMR